LAIPAASVALTAAVNVPAPALRVAGFQVSITGRFWVSTEASGPAVVHGVPRERRPAPAPCAGVQPRQLLAHPGLAGEVELWSLTSVREKVAKIGAKVIAHGRYLVFQMAEVAVPRELFRGILERIAGLRPPVAARC